MNQPSHYHQLPTSLVPDLLRRFLLILSFFAACFPAFAQANTGHIQVNSEPGVRIFLNGDFKGTTTAELSGLIISDVPAGRHVIRAVKEGFNPQESTIDVAAGQVFRFGVQEMTPQIKITEDGLGDDQEVARKVGGILIQSLPIECKVEIPALGVNFDKKQDNMRMNDIPVGEYPATFRAAGRSLQGRIVVKEDTITHVFANVINDRFEIRSSTPAAGGAAAGRGQFEMIAVQGGRLAAASSLGALNVADFQIGKTEVTWSQWKAIRDGARGYDLGDVGQGNGDNHPVTHVSWYDVLKWCNAASEAAGLTPVYTVNGQVYRSGESVPDWSRNANGYRLPSEAEWEFAARGGTRSRGFTYSGSNNLDEVGWYQQNAGGSTKPVASKAANELGLQDMSGNVWEWCWDANGSVRRVRGGSWLYLASYCAVSNRIIDYPDFRLYSIGFRLARSSGN